MADFGPHWADQPTTTLKAVWVYLSEPSTLQKIQVTNKYPTPTLVIATRPADRCHIVSAKLNL